MTQNLVDHLGEVRLVAHTKDSGLRLQLREPLVELLLASFGL